MKLTVKEAAVYAGVSASLIYHWTATRQLTHYRCGIERRRGKILIETEDLDVFLKARKVEAAESTPVTTPRMRSPNAFNNLDTSRLINAWRNQGAVTASKAG